MKKETHPKYSVVTVKCANCDSEFTVGTTSADGFLVSICSQCHPAYTGKNTIIDSTNRVSRFLERQQKSQSLQKVKSK
ncbi:MAG: 50S ribosomal protein L31 [Candidatus Dojkabacteria bacterium]|nr:MAG: 50S ribosomal protein L31 [Candidatus Dojkabacteria bacterium]